MKQLLTGDEAIAEVHMKQVSILRLLIRGHLRQKFWRVFQIIRKFVLNGHQMKKWHWNLPLVLLSQEGEHWRQ